MPALPIPRLVISLCLSLSLTVSPSLPLPCLIWFSLSLILHLGSSVSPAAHCVGSMCRPSPPQARPLSVQTNHRPLMKAALSSMLIPHMAPAYWNSTHCLPSNSARLADLERNRCVRLKRGFIRAVNKTLLQITQEKLIFSQRGVIEPSQ